MNPLLWLALPVVITVVAALLMWRNERRTGPDEAVRLASIAEVLQRDDITGD